MPTAPATSSRPPRILVIDDDVCVCATVRSLLKRHGYETIEAHDANAGVEMAKNQLPDLILCDLHMEESNGLDTLARLRANPATAALPFILTTGDPDPSLQRRSMEGGADDFLSKPFTEQALINAVDTRLKRYASVKDRAAQTSFQQHTEDQLRRLSRAVEQSPVSIVITDPSGNIEYVNPKFTQVTGYSAAEVLGRNPRVLKSGETPPEGYRQLWETIKQGKEWRGQFHNRRKNGELFWEQASISAIVDNQGRITHYLAVKEDITEHKRVEQERAALQLQLQQAQKLESIGRLAAGIAHEINTPTQYVGDNVHFLQKAFSDLDKVLQSHAQLVAWLKAHGGLTEEVAAILRPSEKVRVDFLRREAPKAISDAIEGLTRVTKIVRAMKEFSHPGTEEKRPVDLNHAIESTLTVSRNEWKYVAEMVTDFDPNLPPVPCLPGEFNQVILNLVVNAAHAIADVVGNSQNKGAITVSTKTVDRWAEIRIQDTGTGIPEAVRPRIFEPFFTTKEVGKGTGQGLALAYSVIVERHGGKIWFETEVGRGTTFVIRLPLDAPPSANPSASP